MFNAIALALATMAVPFLNSYIHEDHDNALQIEATLRLEALFRGVSTEKSLKRAERISTFHAQAMTVFHLLHAQFKDERRKQQFAAHFDKLIHTYKF